MITGAPFVLNFFAGMGYLAALLVGVGGTAWLLWHGCRIVYDWWTWTPGKQKDRL